MFAKLAGRVYVEPTSRPRSAICAAQFTCAGDGCSAWRAGSRRGTPHLGVELVLVAVSLVVMTFDVWATFAAGGGASAGGVSDAGDWCCGGDTRVRSMPGQGVCEGDGSSADAVSDAMNCCCGANTWLSSMPGKELSEVAVVTATGGPVEACVAEASSCVIVDSTCERG